MNVMNPFRSRIVKRNYGNSNCNTISDIVHGLATKVASQYQRLHFNLIAKA